MRPSPTHGGPQLRVTSPSSGSTLMTSAPRSPRSIVQYGPARTVDRSATTMPASGPAAGRADITGEDTEARGPDDDGADPSAAASCARDPPATGPPHPVGCPRGSLPLVRWPHRDDAAEQPSGRHALPSHHRPPDGRAETDRPVLPRGRHEPRRRRIERGRRCRSGVVPEPAGPAVGGGRAPGSAAAQSERVPPARRRQLGCGLASRPSNADYAEYRRRVTRTIPVVILEPAPPEPGPSPRPS